MCSLILGLTAESRGSLLTTLLFVLEPGSFIRGIMLNRHMQSRFCVMSSVPQALIFTQFLFM